MRSFPLQSAYSVYVQHHVQRASSSGKGKNSQNEITLKEDLDQRDRLDIYRNFLIYCMSGNIVSLPMGTSGTGLRYQSISE